MQKLISDTDSNIITTRFLGFTDSCAIIREQEHDGRLRSQIPPNLEFSCNLLMILQNLFLSLIFYMFLCEIEIVWNMYSKCYILALVLCFSDIQ